MPRAKRRAPRAKIEYTRVEILRLCVGIALGTDRFGSGPGATKAMALAWRTDSELRERVYEMFDRRASQRRVGKLTRPWATRFDEETSPAITVTQSRYGKPNRMPRPAARRDVFPSGR